MIVSLQLAPDWGIGANLFADLTDVPASVKWSSDGRIVLDFDADLSPQTVAAVKRRLLSSTPAEEALRGEIAARAAAWAATPPTLADLTTQIAALTQLVNGDVE